MKDVNINRSGVFTIADVELERPEARALTEALPAFAIVRDIDVRWSQRGVRDPEELPAHINAQRSRVFRPVDDVAADRARGYVGHLGPEHAPSVSP